MSGFDSDPDWWKKDPADREDTPETPTFGGDGMEVKAFWCVERKACEGCGRDRLVKHKSVSVRVGFLYFELCMPCRAELVKMLEAKK